jgi:hypothetical protein
MRLIGLNGFKESGKDTTFELIKEAVYSKDMRPGAHRFKRHVHRVGFADKLKIMAAKALGFTTQTDDECIALMNECKESWSFDVRAHQESGRGTKAMFSGRQYLQWFGGEARGVFGDTFWIDQVLPEPSKISRGPLRGIETERATFARNVEKELDKRYPGTDILVITDVRYPNEAERVRQLGGEIWEIVKPDLESDGHASEQPLSRGLVDVTLLNDGSIDDLRSLVGNTL